MKRLVPYKDLQALFEFFRKIPGVGERGAVRFGLFFAAFGPEKARNFARLLLNVADGLRICEECGNIAEDTLCWICSDAERDSSVIMAVESVMDLLVFETTGFKGLYHVVGGLVPERIPQAKRKASLEALKRRLEKRKVKEVILAFPYTVRGESLFKLFSSELAGSVPVSRIAKGVPVGGEIEFMDPETLSAAVSRRSFV